jgi:hypothetical protein
VTDASISVRDEKIDPMRRLVRLPQRIANAADQSSITNLTLARLLTTVVGIKRGQRKWISQSSAAQRLPAACRDCGSERTQPFFERTMRKMLGNYRPVSISR